MYNFGLLVVTSSVLKLANIDRCKVHLTVPGVFTFLSNAFQMLMFSTYWTNVLKIVVYYVVFS